MRTPLKHRMIGSLDLVLQFALIFHLTVAERFQFTKFTKSSHLILTVISVESSLIALTKETEFVKEPRGKRKCNTFKEARKEGLEWLEHRK